MRCSKTVLGFGCALGMIGLSSSDAPAVISGSSVVSYVPGDARSDYRNSGSALGLPVGDTGFGAITPFNPAFSSDHLVIVGVEGSLTLQLSSAVVVGSGPEIGVFVNNGLIDVSFDGSGVAGNPAGTFSPFPQALVSVSDDGMTYHALGASSMIFNNPTNAFTDTSIVGYFASPGNVSADYSRPYLGDISDLDGLSYAQMLNELNGSAGGNWLDVSGTGLSSVRFVRFTVPAGADYRLVLDSVTGIPEPCSAIVASMVLGLMLSRRRGTVNDKS